MVRGMEWNDGQRFPRSGELSDSCFLAVVGAHLLLSLRADMIPIEEGRSQVSGKWSINGIVQIMRFSTVSSDGGRMSVPLTAVAVRARRSRSATPPTRQLHHF